MNYFMLDIPFGQKMRLMKKKNYYINKTKMIKKIKKIIEFIKFIEKEKRNASIKIGNGMMLF